MFAPDHPHVEIYIGAHIEHASERDVLKRLMRRLAPLRQPAVVLANVSINGRQIDVIVAMESRLLVIEAKGFHRAVRGRVNGPWQVRIASGQWQDFRNPYVQARDAALKLRDSMRAFANAEVPYPLAAVVFAPRIPSGSDVTSGDLKVRVTDLNGIDMLLQERSAVAWTIDQWRVFARHLGLRSMASVDVACDEQLEKAEALLREYSVAYRKMYTPSEVVVPFFCRARGRKVSSEDLIPWIAERGADALIKGPSGCGKTLLAAQASLAFMARGGIAVTIPIKYYVSDLRAVLEREVGLLVDAASATLLNAARRLNRPLLIVADGYNECAASERIALTRGLAALTRKYEANLVVLSQIPMARDDLFEMNEIEVLPASLETKTAIALNAMGSCALPSDLLSLLSAVPTNLEARLLGEVGQEIRIGSSRFALFDAFARKRMGEIARDGIRVLSQVAGALSGRVTFSLSERDLGRVLDENQVTYTIAQRLLSTGLLTQRGGRVSFAHELYFDAFTAEHVIRRASGEVASVMTTLASPQNAGRKALIVGAIDDDILLAQVLDSTQDAELIDQCAAGECGQVAADWVEMRIVALWERIRAEAQSVCFRFAEQGGAGTRFDEATLNSWTLSERAVLTVVARRLAKGHCLDDALEVVGILDRRIVEEQRRLGEEAQSRQVSLRSALFANAYSIFRIGVAPGISHVCSHLHGGVRSTCDASARAVEKLTENGLSDGQVGLLLMLVRSAPVPASLIGHLIEKYWKSAPYHLRLALLEAAQMSRPEDDDARAALIEVLDALPRPVNILISSALVDALQSLGALEDSVSEHVCVVQGEISQCLADPEDSGRCAAAYGVYYGQFDHPYSSAYSEAVSGLSESERKTLLAMAAKGADDMASFVGLLLVELASFGDPADKDSFERWTALPTSEASMPQDSVGTYLIAHIALGRLGCSLPESLHEANGSSAKAMVACGEILYWINRVDLDDGARQQACSSLLAVVQSQRDAALNVIHCCEESLSDDFSYLKADVAVERSIAKRFPVEVMDICRCALARASEQIGYMKHYSDFDRERDMIFAIGMLACHGGGGDLGLLREHAGDASLGRSAIEAIKVLEGRLVAT